MHRLTRFFPWMIALVLALASLPSQLWAQLPVPQTGTGKLILAAVIPVVGWVAKKGYDGLKQIIPAYDKAPAVVHMALAPLWGFLLGYVSAKLGLVPVDSVAGIDFAWINGGLVALVQAGIFRAEKKAPATAPAG